MKLWPGIFLALLAVIFTIALTFASIELPRLLDTLLAKTVATPDVATGLNELSDYKTELYIQYFHFRLIGYACLILIVMLIVIGFVTEKTGWTSAGAALLFLPVFGHFAATMFFLGGLGLLRLIWLPLLDVSFHVFRLGAISDWPYTILTSFWTILGLSQLINLAFTLTGLGLLLFLLGTFTWFYSKMQKREMADFGIYRFSRHPQYLGWIIWSYGLLYLPGPNIRLCYGLSNSLPWLLSTMIILGIALLEELKMKRIHGDAYKSYCQRTSFLFPLPRIISDFINLPLKVIFKKESPERKREIITVLGFYTLLCLGISALYGGLIPLPEKKPETSQIRIEKLVKIMKESGNFGEKRRAAGELEQMGVQAMEPLIALLNNDQPNVRAYAANALGSMKSERIVLPLIELLNDSDVYVRRSAAGSLGRSGSAQAIQPLSEALQDRTRGISVVAAHALGAIRHPDVIPLLIKVLGDTTLKGTWAATAMALGETGAREAIEPIIQCYEQMPDCPYDAIGIALWKLKSERATEVWITGVTRGSWWLPRVACITALADNKSDKGLYALKEALQDTSEEVRRAAVLALMEFPAEQTTASLLKALQDKDFEVRMYAQEALKKIESRETE